MTPSKNKSPAKTASTVDSVLPSIQRQIERAQRELIENRTTLDGDDGMAVLFTGNHHDAIPRFLITNSELSPNEKVTWQVIRLSISDPNRPGSTPRRDDLAAMIGCTAPTVTACRNMLRIRGWMVFCRSVRERGRFVGNIYLLHDEPLALQSILELDHTYVEFLESQVASTSRRHKTAAAEVLRRIDEMTTGLQPSESDLLGMRIARTINNPSTPESHTHQRKIFSLAGNEGNQGDDGSNNEESMSYDTNLNDQSKYFAMEDNAEIDQKSHQRKKFAPVEKEIIFSQGSSGSYINNKYISTARVHAQGDQRNRSQAKPANQETQSQPTSLDDYREITAMGRWGGPYDESVWIRKHIPLLTAESLQRYVLSLYAGRSNLLPAIYRKLKHLQPHEQEMCLYQLLGRVAKQDHGWAHEALRDPVGYLSVLVNIQEKEKSGLVPDEWALELIRCVKEKSKPKFLDSPTLLAIRGEWNGEL